MRNGSRRHRSSGVSRKQKGISVATKRRPEGSRAVARDRSGRSAVAKRLATGRGFAKRIEVARPKDWTVKKWLLICVLGVVSERDFDSAARHRIFVSSQPGAERGGEAALWCIETGNRIYVHLAFGQLRADRAIGSGAFVSG